MKAWKIKNSFLTCILFFGTNIAWAVDTIIITDIDDTIKISHILDKTEALKRSQSSTSVFIDMPEALALIQNQTQANIYYVSNGPALLMTVSHNNFLKENAFPNGTLSMNATGIGNTKVERIQKIIQNENPKKLILIGDNGEKDIQIYDTITKKYPQIQTHQFIRTIYSQKSKKVLALTTKQNSFVSSAEILLKLLDLKVLSASATEPLLIQIMKSFTNSKEISGLGPAFLTDWYDCRDHKKTQVHFLMRPEYQDYFNAVNARCSRAP